MTAVLPPITVDIGGRSVAVAVRRSARAQRMSLRLDPAIGPVVILPAAARLADAVVFVGHHRIWLAERLARLPDRIALVPGAIVPLLGADHVIRHRPDCRRGVWAEASEVHVSGREEHVPRRVGDFLKAEARRLILPQAFALAARIHRIPCRIGLRDTRTRWGSCSSRGDLSFSWRLVMAPDGVLTYVIAHEVAHLAEMNHSPAFWQVVADLIGDAKPAKAWLKAQGNRLYRYGGDGL